MKPLFFSLSFLISIHTGFACINESGSKPKKEEEQPPIVKLKLALETDLRIRGANMEAELRNATEFERRSDYAVALIYLERSREAITLLERLERERPGQYFIAANLGTAYELSGNNEQALRWIREGIRRDPTSHFGTEWLHVKILEAKIAQQKNPNYFDTESVLNLQEGNADKYAVQSDQILSRSEVKKALQYQLGERLQFVKNRDIPVASLLFDYARIEAEEGSLQSARDILQLSLQFGYPVAKGQALLRSYKRQILQKKAKDIGTKIGSAVLLIGVIGFLFYKWVNSPLQR